MYFLVSQDWFRFFNFRNKIASRCFSNFVQKVAFYFDNKWNSKLLCCQSLTAILLYLLSFNTRSCYRLEMIYPINSSYYTKSYYTNSKTAFAVILNTSKHIWMYKLIKTTTVCLTVTIWYFMTENSIHFCYSYLAKTRSWKHGILFCSSIQNKVILKT